MMICEVNIENTNNFPNSISWLFEDVNILNGAEGRIRNAYDSRLLLPMDETEPIGDQASDDSMTSLFCVPASKPVQPVKKCVWGNMSNKVTEFGPRKVNIWIVFVLFKPKIFSNTLDNLYVLRDKASHVDLPQLHEARPSVFLRSLPESFPKASCHALCLWDQ